MNYKAVIFDLDGTLVDSLADLANSANEMLSGYGFPTHTLDEYRYLVGNGSRKLIQRALPQDKGDLASEALAKYKEIYERRQLEKTRPYEGIEGMLLALKERNIPMGICTNKHQDAAEAIVSNLFPAGIFESVVGDIPGLPRKPDPTKVLKMAKDFNVAPCDVAYLGDTSVDMETAKNAGFLPVGVLWGFRPEDELKKSGAEILLSTPGEFFTKI